MSSLLPCHSATLSPHSRLSISPSLHPPAFVIYIRQREEDLGASLADGRDGHVSDSPTRLWVSEGCCTTGQRGGSNSQTSYVILVSLGLMPLLATVQGTIVTGFRKPAGVPYPNAYATAQQVKENKDAYKFNCAQRAHQNLMENMPQTMVSTLIAGLEYPKAAAALGAGWLVFRALYAYGYIYSAKAHGSGRAYGGLFWVCQGAIWALCCSTGWKML